MTTCLLISSPFAIYSLILIEQKLLKRKQSVILYQKIGQINSYAYAKETSS